MAPPSPEDATSRSGIRRLSNGEAVIPSSTRADGSVRKEIRVKPGYRPPEDVEVYKNRTAEAWKNRGRGGIPGAASAGSEENSSPQKDSAAAGKNAKRREARKKAAAAAVAVADVQAGSGVADDSTGVKNDTLAEADMAIQPAAVFNPGAEASKEAKKLAKKLRQARELKEKSDNGDHLLPEQFAKAIKINELIRQLDTLGFDAAGEEKQKADNTTNENGGTV